MYNNRRYSDTQGPLLYRFTPSILSKVACPQASEDGHHGKLYGIAKSPPYPLMHLPALSTPTSSKEWELPLPLTGKEPFDPIFIQNPIPYMRIDDPQLARVPCAPPPVDGRLTWVEALTPPPSLDYAINYVCPSPTYNSHTLAMKHLPCLE